METGQYELTGYVAAEVAFTNNDCPVLLARQIAEETFERIERGAWMPHRRRLLTHVLVGLRSTKTRELVRQHVRRWINAKGNWQASHYRYLARWPFSAQTLSALWAGIHSEDPSVQLAAGRALAEAAAGDVETGVRAV